MNDYAIMVENLSKEFVLPHNKKNSLKQAAIGLVKRDTSYEVQQALQDVSFEIKKGDFFGIVGRNGSGKSTLLRVMAGVYTPSRGGVHVNGTLVPFIELGVGFNPDLSGRDNVFLNGALLGFSRAEMEKMYDEIVEFAELERFMDQKLKNYSSGMQVRLAFSIAIQARGDILVLDEVLAVGDAAFQRKCLNYFNNLKLNNQTVVLVTHSMDTIEKYCDRAAMLHDGKLAHIGTPDDIAQEYRDINVQNISSKKTKEDERKHDKTHATDVKVNIVNSEGDQVNSLKPEEKLILDITVKTSKPIEGAVLGLTIFNSDNIPIFASNTGVDEIDINLDKDEKFILKYTINNIFSNGAYKIKASLRDKDNMTVYFKNDQIANFRSLGRKHSYALASPEYTLETKRGS